MLCVNCFLGEIVKAADFLKEVKQELIKVKWPTLKEVSLISLFVVIAASVAGVIFLLIDSVIYKVVRLLLGVGGVK